MKNIKCFALSCTSSSSFSAFPSIFSELCSRGHISSFPMSLLSCQRVLLMVFHSINNNIM